MTCIRKKISYSRSFKKEYQRLPHEIQENLDRKLRLLLEDPRHSSLRLKKMGSTIYWEVSITMNDRLVLKSEADEIRLITVGTHDVLRKI